MPKVRCASCKGYVEKESANKVGIQNYCVACNPSTWRSSGTPMKRSWIKKKPAKNPMPVGLRDEVLAADGGRCRFCGSTENLHVHHIVYRSGGGKHAKDNLITLCMKHHDTVHSDKPLFQPMCLEIVRRREGPGKDKQSLIKYIHKAKKQQDLEK